MDDEIWAGEGTGAPAHPRFTAHFTDPLYDDPADDFAPFGQDDGADLLAEWSERRDELDGVPGIAALLSEELESPADHETFVRDLDNPEDVDSAFWVLGAGFVLLRLTGRMSEPDRLLLLKALSRLESFYGPREAFSTMRRDLESWTA